MDSISYLKNGAKKPANQNLRKWRSKPSLSTQKAIVLSFLLPNRHPSSLSEVIHEYVVLLHPYHQIVETKLVNGKFESSDKADITNEPVYCVASKSTKRCYIACEDYVIRSYKLDSFEFEDVIYKSTQPINCLAINHDSTTL